MTQIKSFQTLNTFNALKNPKTLKYIPSLSNFLATQCIQIPINPSAFKFYVFIPIHLNKVHFNSKMR